MAKSSNVNAIISFGQQISGTLQNIQQMRWQFALSKAKMSRDERIRQDEMSFARKAAMSLAQQKQAEAKAKEQAHSENLLGRLLQKFPLTEQQQQQVLDGVPITGGIKARPTNIIHTTRGGTSGGRYINIKEQLLNTIIKGDKEGLEKLGGTLKEIKKIPEIWEILMSGLGVTGESELDKFFRELNEGSGFDKDDPLGLRKR